MKTKKKCLEIPCRTPVSKIPDLCYVSQKWSFEFVLIYEYFDVGLLGAFGALVGGKHSRKCTYMFETCYVIYIIFQ